MNPFYLWTCFLMTVSGLSGCNKIGGLSFVPAIPGYDQIPKNTLLLKKPLREISGITYNTAGELAAINDEEGVLFFINPKNGTFRKQLFGKKGDYEDIVQAGSEYFILKSNGDLHEVNAANGKEQAIYKNAFPRFVEFESLCYDQKNEQLLLICKSCGREEQFIHVWRFDLKTRTYIAEKSFSLSWSDIRKLAKDDTVECLPSAASFHPLTGQLFIIASLGKILLQCTPEGKLVAVHRTNPYVFPQPEGLCFAPNGDLYISNEGRQSKASILFFPYNGK
jgi:uncharacterized protein YjiK